MSLFTPNEVEFLAGQQHGRLATVDSDGRPHVVPVAFRHDPHTDVIDISGPIIVQTKKYRDIQDNPWVAFVIDDILPPWRTRGIEVRGRASLVPEGGKDIHPGFLPEAIRIRPLHVATWGVEEEGVRSSRTIPS